jgi:Dyp-type peroxidase family
MRTERINHKDIQALFRGFDKRWPIGRFYYCRYENPEAGRELLQEVGALTSYLDLDDYPEVAVNAALTYNGLRMLGLNPDVLGGFPGDFRQGMLARADLNGDVGENAPEKWDDVWKTPGNVHLWLGIYAKSPKALDDWENALTFWIADREAAMREKRNGSGGNPEITVLGTQDVKRFWSDPDTKMHIDDPSTNPDKKLVLEHFGFRDGVSQPNILGFELHETQKHGGGRLLPDGSWEPLAPGEFIFGHVDVMGEIPLAPVPPALSRNGSFMVHRKLEQDVDGFRKYLSDKAAAVSSPDGEVVTADYLAEKIVGRKRDGTPLADAKELNDFRYSRDLEGAQCPLGAHMRRANPRDALGVSEEVCKKNGSTLVDRHRILRRAITYGDPVPTSANQQDVNPDGQGLMFMTLQTSITRQFEFVQQQWINFGNDMNQGDDRDPLVGKQNGKGRVAIPGDAENPTVICGELPQFVNTRGGDYFFLPGVSAFSRLAAGKFAAINTES